MVQLRLIGLTISHYSSNLYQLQITVFFSETILDLKNRNIHSIVFWFSQYFEIFNENLKNYSHVSLVEVPVHVVHETCTRAWSRTGRRTGRGSRSSEQGRWGERMFCR